MIGVTYPHSPQFQAIEKFQCLRDKRFPGSREYEIAEKAIDLSLNATRAGDEYVLRNAYRDARRTIDRSSQKYSFLSIDAANDNSADDQLLDGLTQVAVGGGSPESILIAEEAIQCVLLSSLGDRATVERVLQGLVEGEVARETAKALNIGPNDRGR